jgi:putative phosphoribosyl transferase
MTIVDAEITIPVGGRRLAGNLALPEGATGIVVFAHGSGSGRFSPRNQFVASTLRDSGLATLLLDLLEENEAANREKVFDIQLLASRLEAASTWLVAERETHDLSQGYFGASTGAGAALVAAANQPERIQAVVSRGGRPDLALESLSRVKAPTLLIVGGEDTPVIRMNVDAQTQLQCTNELIVIPGATHLFEEPGTLEEVARLATQWFGRYLVQNA